MGLYEKIGVKRMINAGGHATVRGGSTIGKEVVDAMLEANTSFVDMWELQKQTGKIIAEICGAEAGWITPGCFAALVLSAAACMAGKDREKIRKIPDTSGMKNQIILQRSHRYGFDRAMEVPGGRFVIVGDKNSCSPQMIESAINEKTAAILYLSFVAFSYAIPTSRRAELEGSVPEEEVIKIGKKHGVPVIVDAAHDFYPLDLVRRPISMGADLACYGGKYINAPHSTGFVVGRKDLIESVAMQSFIGFHQHRSRALGRGYKLDRQEIVGLTAALQHWMNMDHKKRIEAKHKKVRYLKSKLVNIPGVKIEDIPDGAMFFGFRIVLENKTAEETKELYEKDIRGGNPKIELYGSGDNGLIVNVVALQERNVKPLTERLYSILTSHCT